MWPPSLQTPSVVRTLAICSYTHWCLLGIWICFTWASCFCQYHHSWTYSHLICCSCQSCNIASDLEAAIQQKKYREMSQGSCFPHDPPHLEASGFAGDARMEWPFEDSCGPPGKQQRGRLDCHLKNALIRGAFSPVDRTHVHSDFLLSWSAKEDSVIAPSFPSPLPSHWS